MKYLLIDGDNISVNPELAKELGINHAITLQQLHFLLTITRKTKKNYNFVDGQWWVYNSYKQWRDEHFKWLSESAIKGIFRDLELRRLVIKKQGVKSKFDRKKWYRIDYTVFEELAESIRQKMSHENGQKMSHDMGQEMSDVYTETTTENTPETTYPSPPSSDDAISVWTQLYGDKGKVSGHVINQLVTMVEEHGNETVVAEIQAEKRRYPSMSIQPSVIERRLQYKPYTDEIMRVLEEEPAAMTGNSFKVIFEAAEQLKGGGYTPEQIPMIHAYCKAQGWPSFGAGALATHAPKWKKKQGQEVQTSQKQPAKHYNMLEGI